MQEDDSFKSRMFLDISLWALDRLPRTTWKGIEGIIGFNTKSHIDFGRLPMMVRNDLGGSSSQNFKHWMQIWFSDSFQTLETRNQKPEDYKVSRLAENLKNTNIFLFAGKKDALTSQKDF